MKLSTFFFCSFFLLCILGNAQIIEEGDPNYKEETPMVESDTVQYHKALKLQLARMIGGDYAANFEIRTFNKQSFEFGAGITRPWRSDPQSRFPGQFAPEFGWSASGSYRFYLGNTNQLKGFSFELAYRYQHFNGGVDEFEYSTSISQDGHRAIYHHYNGIMAYQIVYEKFVMRAYFGLGLYDRSTYTVEETEGGEVDEGNNQLLTNYEHAVRKVVTRYPSVKTGIDIGFRW